MYVLGFGLINQTTYAFAQAPVMASFRELLEKGKKFYWDETLETVFQQSKEAIINAIKDGVKSFQLNRPTWLSTDWAKIWKPRRATSVFSKSCRDFFQKLSSFQKLSRFLPKVVVISSKSCRASRSCRDFFQKLS